MRQNSSVDCLETLFLYLLEQMRTTLNDLSQDILWLLPYASCCCLYKVTSLVDGQGNITTRIYLFKETVQLSNSQIEEIGDYWESNPCYSLYKIFKAGL
jgi:hypothetical protein